MQPAIQKAIAMMHQRYSEPLTLNHLAAEVFVSPFHFSRVFSRATGVTPGRYLTAVRLFAAKRLLLTTSMTVSDIVCGVGYSSVGTFTSRFTRLVGITPTSYRDPRVGDLLVAVSPDFQRLPPFGALRQAGDAAAEPTGNATIRARIQFPAGVRGGEVLVGVFADIIPQCAPVAFTAAAVPARPARLSGPLGVVRSPDPLGVVRSPGRFGVASSSGLVGVTRRDERDAEGPLTADLTLTGVPAGRWHVLAAASHPAGAGSPPCTFAMLRYPITLAGTENASITLPMHTPQPTDPPIAITLASRLGRTNSRRAVGQVRYLRAA